MKGADVKSLLVISMSIVIAGLPAIPARGQEDDAARVLSRFFDEVGGMEELAAIEKLSVKVRLDAYDYEYTTSLGKDGCFRIEADNITTTFDGSKYWRSFHGLTDPLTPEEAEEYRNYSLDETVLLGLLGQDGRPTPLDYAGKEEKHGTSYEVLATSLEDGREKTYYFNTDTGMLDKMVELADDPELRRVKNIYYFSEYTDVGEVKLVSRTEAVCITSGQNIQPLSNLTDFKVNQPPDDGLFTKPPRTAPQAVFQAGTLTGKIIGFSGRGSAIANITKSDMGKLGVEDGAMLTVRINDHETTHRYIEDIRSAQNLGPGDFVAAFNNTPALWLVKAYVGMTGETTMAEGDPITIRREEAAKNALQEGK